MTPSKTQIANAFKAAKVLGINTDEIRPVIKDLYKVFPKNWEHVEANNYRVLFDRYFEMKGNKGEAEKRDERPGKRAHLVEENQVSKRTGSSFELPLKHSIHSANVQFPHKGACGNGKLHPARASTVSPTSHTNYLKKPKDEVSTYDAIVSAERTSMRRPGPVGASIIQRIMADSNGASLNHEDKKPIIYISDIGPPLGLDLSFVDFSYACLKNVFFSRANLHCAKFKDADAEGAIFHNANLRECEFTGANLRGALLAGTNLQSANLQDACLIDCSFCQADLRSAHLQSADLSNANLEGAILEGANLKEQKEQYGRKLIGSKSDV